MFCAATVFNMFKGFFVLLFNMLLHDYCHTFSTSTLVQQVMDLSLPRLILFILFGCVRCSPDDHHRSDARRFDYCVLGAGPAGLQMGYFLSKTKRNYIILERNSGPGSFFNK